MLRGGGLKKKVNPLGGVKEVTPWEVSISVASFFVFFVFLFFCFWRGKKKGKAGKPLMLLSSQAETDGGFQSRGDGTILGIRMQASGVPMASMSRNLFIS